MDRTRGIGGSDAMRIKQGKWLSLYNEKVGLVEPEDLSHNFPVQLGITTEDLHRKWFEYKTGYNVIDSQKFTKHKRYLFMNGHIDGYVEDEDMLVELKHTNAFSSMRDKVQYYMPQLQHYISVFDVTGCYLSCIFGNAEPEITWVNKDPEYINELIQLESSFWWHVTERIPPDDQGNNNKLDDLAEQIPIGGMKAYDMSTSNSWGGLAETWLNTIEAKKTNEATAKELKSLMPRDAYEAYGNGIIIKRDKRGSLRLTEKKGN
jgi:predicted phage-related endonuclease